MGNTYCKKCNVRMVNGVSLIPYYNPSRERHCIRPSYKLGTCIKCPDCGYSTQYTTTKEVRT